jgi:lycopene cyclase domain-containing protein
VTYAEALLVFVAPAIGVAAVLARRAIDRRFVLVVAGLVVIASIATFPWDTQAVRWGIWRYDEAKTCGVRLGLLPVEECAFFGLQTIFVALLYGVLRRR